MKVPEKIELSVNIVNAILGYLGSQPYQGVAQLINAIQQEASPQIPAPAPVESNEE